MDKRPVLICCIVVPQKLYSMEHWFNAINNLTGFTGKSIILLSQKASIFENGNDWEMIKDYNKLREFCVEQGYNVLFVDSDVILPPDAYEKLVNADKLIIGGIVMHPTEYNVWKDGTGPAEASLPLERQPVAPNTGIKSCSAIGFGCVFIHYEVLKSIKFNNTYNGKLYSKGFDLVTCLRLKDMGYDIYAHTDVLPKHYRKVSGEWIDEPPKNA